MAPPPSPTTEVNDENFPNYWKTHHLSGMNYFDPKDPPLLVMYVSEPMKEGE